MFKGWRFKFWNFREKSKCQWSFRYVWSYSSQWSKWKSISWRKASTRTGCGYCSWIQDIRLGCLYQLLNGPYCCCHCFSFIQEALLALIETYGLTLYIGAYCKWVLEFYVSYCIFSTIYYAKTLNNFSYKLINKLK